MEAKVDDLELETETPRSAYDKLLREISKRGLADEMDLWIATQKPKPELDPLLDKLSDCGLIKRVKNVNASVPMDGFILTLDGQHKLDT